MPFALRDGVRLYWRADGHPDRPVLLLLNSVGADHAMWNGVVRALSGRFRLLRMDARGHGASDVPPGDYTMQDLALDALAVLDAAGAPKAAVAGVSLGGMTAMQLAVTAPDRLTAIAICNSTADIPAQSWHDRAAAIRSGGTAAMADAIMARWFPPAVRAANPPYLATARATFEALDKQGYAGCCMAIAGLDVKDKLPGITTPTLVVAGSLDEATPPATGSEPIAAAIPGAKLVSLPTGHISALERPDALAALLADFFLPGEAPATWRRVATPCSTPASTIAAPSWATPGWTARSQKRAGSPGNSSNSSPASPGARCGAARGSTTGPGVSSCWPSRRRSDAGRNSACIHAQPWNRRA